MFYSIIRQAESLFHKFEREYLLKPQIVIITGDIQEGKTTFTRRIIDDLIEQKFRISGFLSIAINDNGVRTGFNLMDIDSSEQIELCSDKKDDNRVKLGRFYFNHGALIFGNRILNPDNLAGKQLIVIDEIGPLEINGQGWSNSIDNITRSYTIPHLWVVRKSLVQKISKKWNIGDAWVFDISNSSITEVEEKLIEIMV
jgi:nucleoside-triphosphatase THEP1